MNTPFPWPGRACLALLGLLLPVLVGAAPEALPVDPAVRTGQLPNGLTYFIRKNAKPEKRVELRLAVNAGSVQEDDDQLGLAHLVEHMCFKGTKSFPKADLLHYLQSVGAGFGPDINAYTGFDETVYQLSLPSDVPETLNNGLKIMREWAHDVNFDPADIDLERGVVVEEWRLGRGATQRMRDKSVPIMFRGSKYARRLPIGTKESIEGMSHETIKRCYREWYRPDQMAMIVVGDVDPDQMEQTIRTQFGSLPIPPAPRPKEDLCGSRQ
ncbi:MAG: pitrilysin family protein [Verrucomicrobiota bacterium]